MYDNVYIQNTNQTEYKNDELFNPKDLFPEGLDIALPSDKKIYENFREMLINMKLDYNNIGTKQWNPFSEFIKLNNNVVIKPNLVFHVNYGDGNMDSLITNFSLIRPIIDYTVIALKGTGKIIVGDAPVQECNFDEVIEFNNLKSSMEKYNNLNYKIDLTDFRKNNNTNLECIEVSLDKDSSLCEVDKYWKQFAISNYDLRIMHSFHNVGKHKYLIAKDILEADVIINIPKAKTHRIAGFTGCMKNFIGANAKKEYLPHHRNGNIYNNGDEYPERSLLKKTQSFVKNYTYKHNKLIDAINLSLRGVQKILGKNKYLKGCWYGNDTIWRTILDINKIIVYADKNGIMKRNRQRTILNFVDMIISGEKDGPLKPKNKEVGLIIGGFNQLHVDSVICMIMGFECNKIKYLFNGYKLKKYKLSKNKKYKIYDQDGIVKNMEKYNKSFIPANGWDEYL